MISSPKRFDEKNFVKLYTLDYDLLGSKFLEYIFRDSTFLEYVIPEKQAYRIDLISKAIYGSSSLFWILQAINSLVYIEEIAKFKTIKYVSLRDIESAYFKYKQSL